MSPNPAVTLGLWSAGRCANKHACFLAEFVLTFFREPSSIMETTVVEKTA